MAFNNAFTAVTGATYTAAQYNTYVRDNLTAIWVYTTAGDIAYATGATGLTRLAAGSTFQVLSIAGGLPVWRNMTEFCLAYKSAADQSYNSGVVANITFDAEIDSFGWHDTVTNNDRVTVISSGYYVPVVAIYFNKDTGGSGTFHLTARVQVNGVDSINKATIYESVDANTKMFTFGGLPVFVAAGSYLSVSFTQDSGGSGKLIKGSSGTMLAVGRIS